MPLTKEEKNKAEINTFLEYNNIDPHNAMGYNNKFETTYYVGENRMFREETPIGFDIVSEGNNKASLHDINDIEFATSFKTVLDDFSFDEDHETLTISGNDPTKHNKGYKVVISSIYLDF